MKLRVIQGENPGQSLYLIRETFSIGRESDNDCVIGGEGISRHHCRLRQIDGEWLLEDLNSVNGVYMNGERVQRARLIRPGDRLTICEQVFLFQEDEADMPYELVSAAMQQREALVETAQAFPETKPAALNGESAGASPLQFPPREEAFQNNGDVSVSMEKAPVPPLRTKDGMQMEKTQEKEKAEMEPLWGYPSDDRGGNGSSLLVKFLKIMVLLLVLAIAGIGVELLLGSRKGPSDGESEPSSDELAMMEEKAVSSESGAEKTLNREISSEKAGKTTESSAEDGIEPSSKYTETATEIPSNHDVASGKAGKDRTSGKGASTEKMQLTDSNRLESGTASQEAIQKFWGTLPDVGETAGGHEGGMTRSTAKMKISEDKKAVANPVPFLPTPQDKSFVETLEADFELPKHSEVSAPARDVLCVTSEPPGATVREGRVIYGVTPLKISNLCSGDHEFTVERGDCQSQTAKTHVKSNECGNLHVVLPTLLGELNVVTCPFGCTVSVDGVVIGQTASQQGIVESCPLKIKGVVSGESVIRVMHEATGRAVERKVSVRPGVCEDVNVFIWIPTHKLKTAGGLDEIVMVLRENQDDVEYITEKGERHWIERMDIKLLEMLSMNP